jgi:hypothetical protein
MIRAYALGIITGAFLTAGTMMLAAPAKADGHLSTDEQVYVEVYGGAICSVLSDARYHTFAGVVGVTEAVAHDGFTLDNAVDIVNAAVENTCPANWGLLQAVGKAARAANGTTA